MDKIIPPYTESEFPGFYLIEGFSRYAANEDGRILDLKRLNIIPIYRDDRGYQYVSMVNDAGKRVLYQHYRALMIAMSDRPDNYPDLVINHKDNIHGNDELDNLEWTTHLGNSQHAKRIGALVHSSGSKQPRRKIKILEVKESKEFEFESLSSASEYLGINPRRLKKILLLDQPFFRGDYLIKEFSDKRPWRKVKIGEKIYNETGNIILVRDIDTEVVSEWPSYQQYAEALGISKDAVAWRMRAKNQRPFPERRQYKFKGDPTPWRNPTEQELLELESYGNIKAILVKDLQRNKIFRYPSQREMCKALRISEPTASLWMSKSNQIHAQRYLIQEDSVNPKWREVNDLQSMINAESKYRKIVAVTHQDGSVKTYPSANQAAIAMGLLATTVNNRLKSNGGKVFQDGTRWKYL